MRKKIFALVLTTLAVIILVGGLFAFYNYPRASPRASYRLSLDNIGEDAFLDGVPLHLTPGHGQLVQIQIFVASQHDGNSTMLLSYTIPILQVHHPDAAGSVSFGDITSSTYTVGQTIIIHRTYQDGYAETTNSSIPLTQQMLVAGLMIPPLGYSGPIPRFFEIPVQQWVLLAHAQGVQGPQADQSPQGIYPYDLAWLNVATPLVALIVSAMVLIRGFSKAPKEADK